jgi:hypothetical protein
MTQPAHSCQGRLATRLPFSQRWSVSLSDPPPEPFNPSPPLGRDIGEMFPNLPGQVSLPG